MDKLTIFIIAIIAIMGVATIFAAISDFLEKKGKGEKLIDYLFGEDED